MPTHILCTSQVFLCGTGEINISCMDRGTVYTWHHLIALSLVMHMVFVNMSGATYTPRSSGVNAADIPSCLDFSASTLLKGLLLCFIKTVLLLYTLVKSFAIVYFKRSCTLKRGANMNLFNMKSKAHLHLLYTCTHHLF